MKMISAVTGHNDVNAAPALLPALQVSLNLTANMGTRTGWHRKHIHSIVLPVTLGISAKKVPQHNVPECGCKNCPTASAIAAALGRSCWRQLFLPSNRASDELRSSIRAASRSASPQEMVLSEDRDD